MHLRGRRRHRLDAELTDTTTSITNSDLTTSSSSSDDSSDTERMLANPKTPTPTVLDPIYLLYDERMLLHQPVGWVPPDVFPEYLDEIDDDYQMENPERLRVIYERLVNLGKRLLARELPDHESLEHQDLIFQPLECEMATKSQILLAHSRDLYERLEQMQYCSDWELATLTEPVKNDIYFSRETFQAARLAAGGLLSCVNTVCAKDAPMKKSLALVRPPGHHACQSKEMGFCFIDSVVVAAKYALQQKKASRIVILDWDIHDGNGTAEGTRYDENILRIDIHRYNPKEGFYPYTGAPNDVGSGNARGLNLNLGWSQGGMRNTEYAAAFYELILPILADYRPDLMLISCGLDAAMGDLLGGCELTPGFFHAMTRASLEAVGLDCPVVCALEGGYAMNVLPDCMEAVTLAMLNCPYSYHSSEQWSAGGGAAAVHVPGLSNSNRLARARHTLSKYYVRGPARSSLLLYSAVQDINTSIRIFKNLTRWEHLNLKTIKGPPKPSNFNSTTSGTTAATTTSSSNKKRKAASGEANTSFSAAKNQGDVTTWIQPPPFQRPRVYLWYGTEWHHQGIW